MKAAVAKDLGFDITQIDLSNSKPAEVAAELRTQIEPNAAGS